MMKQWPYPAALLEEFRDVFRLDREISPEERSRIRDLLVWRLDRLAEELTDLAGEVKAAAGLARGNR
jgi:hypothetical protein